MDDDLKSLDLILRDSDSAESAKEQLARVKEEAERETRKIQAEVIKRERTIQARMAEAQRDLERLHRETQAALEPFKRAMAQLKEGLWTIELYLGTKEQIYMLREGEAAPEDEPICMRQLVLAMDEECAVAAEDGGIDSLSIGQFDKWLLADQAHVDQVIPEQKGVVALVPRWQGKRYEDPWMQQAADDGNRQTYFLLRNGEQLYRIWTEFNAGKNLIPKREEYEEIFVRKAGIGSDREPTIIRPGTKDWDDAQEEADARERHYMRVALIFEGLIHRTTVWHPVAEDVSFIDPKAHREGKVRFIMDGEEDRLLGTGREPWDEWLRRNNARLRPGMRIIISNSGLRAQSHSLNSSYRADRYNPRTHPSSDPPMPEPCALLRIEHKNGKGKLVVPFERQDEIWDPDMWVVAEAEAQKRRPPNVTAESWGHRGGYRKPKTRGSFWIEPTDDWVLPFDAITEDEIRERLMARLERPHYISMFPVLKAALVAKRQERESEEPFRVMLSGVLARENGGTVAAAEQRIPALVEWYKLANRHHRALEEDDAKAVRLIVREDARRLAADKEDSYATTLAEEHPDYLLIARKKSGYWVVLEPMADDDQVFARYSEFTKTGKRYGEVREWWKPEPHVVNNWRPVESTERWRAWDLGAVVKDCLTGPERDFIVKRILSMKPKDEGGRRKKTDKGGKPKGGWLAVSRSTKNEHGREMFFAWRERDDQDRNLDQVEAAQFSWSRSSSGEITIRDRSGYGWGTPVSHVHGSYKRTAFSKDDGEDAQWLIREIRNDRLLWIDEQAVSAIEQRVKRREIAAAKRAEREARAHPYIAIIEGQRRERGEREHVAAFVEKYEHVELYEGHMKAHRDARYEHQSLKSEGKLLRAILKALDAGETLWGKTLGEVWSDAPAEDRDLVFDEPERTCENCGRVWRGEDVYGYTMKLFIGSRDGEVRCRYDCEGPQDDKEDEDDLPEGWSVEEEVLELGAGEVTRSRCTECGEMKADPDEFYDGLRCTACCEAELEAAEAEG